MSFWRKPFRRRCAGRKVSGSAHLRHVFHVVDGLRKRHRRRVARGYKPSRQYDHPDVQALRLPDKAGSYCWTVKNPPGGLDTPPIVITRDKSPFGVPDGNRIFNWYNPGLFGVRPA